MTTKEIEVQILGKNFNFNIPESVKTEEFLEIIDFVEARFVKIKAEASSLDPFRLGLLVAINLTEEFYAIKKENDKMRGFLKKIDSLISPVEEGERVSISFSS